MVDLADLIAGLRDLSDEEIVRHGFAVEGTLDEVDDPVLLGPHGRPIETWREDYSYEARMSRFDYKASKRPLQIELLKVQSRVIDEGLKIAVVFEGCDCSGAPNRPNEVLCKADASSCVIRVGRFLYVIAGMHPLPPASFENGSGDPTGRCASQVLQTSCRRGEATAPSRGVRRRGAAVPPGACPLSPGSAAHCVDRDAAAVGCRLQLGD